LDCKTITVFSNKGGVGKTFVTVNIATALALAGEKVLLIDLDLQAGQDMARMLNLNPRNTMVDLFAQGEDSSDAKGIQQYASIHSSGINFLPAVQNTQQLGEITPENLRPFLKKAASHYDYILIDAGKSFSDSLIASLDYSNLILLVATPDVLAVYQIKWCLDVLQSLQFPPKMIRLFDL